MSFPHPSVSTTAIAVTTLNTTTPFTTIITTFLTSTAAAVANAATNVSSAPITSSTDIERISSTPMLVAGICALLAIIISVRHIHQHLTHFIVPHYQLHIIRILAMVPIYCVTSFLALLSTDEFRTLMLDLLRDSYEAYVIYNFVILLINYGGGHFRLCRYLEDCPRMEHSFPVNLWLPPFKLGPAFLSAVRASVLQFVFVKPINSLLKLYLHVHEHYAYRSLLLILIVILNNISVSVALYGLVLFYHAAYDRLRPFRPFEKFISVKAIVFFSFWQGFVMGIAVNIGLIRSIPGFPPSRLAPAVQDVFICVEMAVASIAHLFVFTFQEYEPMVDSEHVALTGVTSGGSVTGSSNKNPLLEVVDFRDVLSDAKDRFYGGVGFESELTDGAPIIPNVDHVLRWDSSNRERLAYAKPVSRSGVSGDLLPTPWRLSRPPHELQHPESEREGY